MAMVLKRKKLTMSEKVEINHKVERNPTVLRIEIMEHLELTLSSLNSIMFTETLNT
jgi:hypothetical protein